MKKILCTLSLILTLSCVLASCNSSLSPNFEIFTTLEETTTTPDETTPEETTPEVPDVPFVPSTGLAYEVNDDGKTCTVIGIGTCTDTDIYIGGSIDGYKVTAIGDIAFYKCTSLTSVTIGDSVIMIGSNAFYACDGLKSITIPDSVMYIDSYAFTVCTSLTSITIPDSVTYIGDAAFSSCISLASITIGNGITNFPASVFSFCTSLESLTIPDGVRGIGYGAFYGCTSLTSVTFSNPNGWWGENSDASRMVVSADDLSNLATAAEYLKSTYTNYYWFRTE